MTILSVKIEEYKLSKYEKTAPLFLFLVGQMHQNQSFVFIFIGTISKMKLNTLVTKCTDTITFNFAHILFILGG